MQIAVRGGTKTLDLVDGSCAAAPELQNGTAVSMNHTGKPPLDQGAACQALVAETRSLKRKCVAPQQPMKEAPNAVRRTFSVTQFVRLSIKTMGSVRTPSRSYERQSWRRPPDLWIVRVMSPM